MNIEFYIAKKISGRRKASLSKPFINIAVLSIALGLAVMIISIFILTGFQKEIRNKIIGFGSHIQISNFDQNSSYEYIPISKKQSFYPYFDTIKGIRHIQVFGIKAGIIKTNEQMQGVILKGIGSDYDWSFFKDKIKSGSIITIKDTVNTNKILISSYIASQLKLKLNDNVFMYFIQDPPRVRKFTVNGIYETGLEDFDKIYVICDIKHIQKLNNWTEDDVSGFEILINDFNDLDEIYNYVYHNVGYSFNAQTIKQLYPEIFSWLELMDMNVIIILIIMLLVSSITMVSTLLVLVLEKTNMIGILKALGIKNISIRKIFLYNAAYIVAQGLLFGNILALTLCFLQYKYHLIALSQESYYVSYVPINFNFLYLLAVNFGTLIACVLILIIPSFIITRINPIKAIRYE